MKIMSNRGPTALEAWGTKKKKKTGKQNTYQWPESCIENEKPRYYTGHATVLAYMSLFLLGGTVFMWTALKRENSKRRSGKRDNMHAGKTPDEIWVAGDNRPDFIYSL